MNETLDTQSENSFFPAIPDMKSMEAFLKNEIDLTIKVCDKAHASAHVSNPETPDKAELHLPYLPSITHDAMLGVVCALGATQKYQVAGVIGTFERAFTKELFMMLENIRCERMLMAEYPNVEKYITAYKDFFDTLITSQLDGLPPDKTTIYAIKTLLEDRGTIIMDDMMLRLDAELKDARDAKTTEDNRVIALAIEKRITEILDEAEKLESIGQELPPAPTTLLAHLPPEALNSAGQLDLSKIVIQKQAKNHQQIVH